ncbi:MULTISPECIES: hypothetical protein [unclassified Streptomyces]|uniref:hypothetical protein n=1 Tax=unclassified Streptomyces TaxID=2593676 RepID=UPI0022B61571|nr:MULTISPECIES: hypothetical protein [unclassified Streptomyces]MCZ7416839.1 hypothetical protein [Streptomyces sp. WMMC897]MCZ7433346.1 hypothetical protein [Streptomyces sp. WMMC1477]
MTKSTDAVNQLHEFVKFSSAVTGFSEFDLWGTGQAEAYYEAVLNQEGPDALRKVMDSDPHAVPADPVVNSVIKLWYVGVWYGPELVGRMDVAAWTAPGRSGGKPAVPDGSRPEGTRSSAVSGQHQAGEDPAHGGPERKPLFVVSPDAYTEGLLWRAIGAHPSGAKAPGYGSWVNPPVFEI